jgi:leucyl-tRNA synthetase
MKKLWRLYHDERNSFSVSDELPSSGELKILHKTIKKVEDDILRFSLNTVVSNLMTCVNELTDLKCNKRAVLEDLAVILSPYAPHVAEELWQLLGHNESIIFASYPACNEEYLKEDLVTYAVSFNGKLRFTLDLPVDMTNPEIEKVVLSEEKSKKWLEGKAPRKIIIVPGKIINLVV